MVVIKSLPSGRDNMRLLPEGRNSTIKFLADALER